MNSMILDLYNVVDLYIELTGDIIYTRNIK